MIEIPAALCADYYKQSHYKQYSPHTQVVYSTWTPRKSRMEGVDEVVVFGLQYFIKDFLIDSFNKTFFNRPKEEVIAEFKRVMKNTIGTDDASHWETLHDLGYLPLKICALEEGTLCPIRVPMFTVENTLPEFYWLTNFIETIMSTEIWKPMTSATIALQYRKICEKWAEKTCDNSSHIDFQCHDFSLRGMAGLDAGCSSGAGHLLSFKGSDTIPAVCWLEKYYNANCEKELIATSIPATEHSVAETNIIEMQDVLNVLEEKDLLPYCVSQMRAEGKDDRCIAEFLYLTRLLEVYEAGVFSYVADTYNLWDVLTQILPKLKYEIMERDGKLVVRPDSGDPVDIICGLNTNDKYQVDGGIAYEKECGSNCGLLEIGDYAQERTEGVIELLWNTFGGTVNEKGYKVLDSHVGCIYGDAITLERADEICRRLESKGFASSNIVLGVGSYTYNMNTRDTFGFALKTTYGVVNGKELMLYKDPITDDGTKKSQKGLVSVHLDESTGKLAYRDEMTTAELEKDKSNLLTPLFLDGKLLREISLNMIRSKLSDPRVKVLSH